GPGVAGAGGGGGGWGGPAGAAGGRGAGGGGLASRRLALGEPPYILAGSRPRPPADTARIYSELVAAGRRGDAVEYFMTKVVELPAEFAAAAREAPWWPAQEALAHTLAYDATVMGDYSLPTERVGAVRVPTLVLVGGASMPWMAETAKALVDLLPNGQQRTLEGQEHNVAPEAMAPALAAFFEG